MKTVKNLLALAVLGLLVLLVAGAAYCPTETFPTPAAATPARARTSFVPTRLEVLVAELATVDRGIARVADDVRAGRQYDHAAADVLLRQRDVLSTLVEVERLKVRK